MIRANLEMSAGIKLLQLKVHKKGKVEKEDVEQLEKLALKYEKVFDELEKNKNNPYSAEDINLAIAKFKLLKQDTAKLREMVKEEGKKKKR